MKLVKFIISSFSIGVLSISVFAQKQTVLVPPNDALNRNVRPWVVESDDTITRLITFSLIHASVSGGVAFPLGVDEEARVTLQSTGLTLKDVLDSIVRVEPAYRWEFTQGVVNLLPVKDSPVLLDTLLYEFHQQKVTARQMIEALERTPEVRGQAAALGFSEEQYFLYSGLVSTETFTVRCKKATVREILNEIVRVRGGAVWSYQEYSRDGKKYFQLGFLLG